MPNQSTPKTSDTDYNSLSIQELTSNHIAKNDAGIFEVNKELKEALDPIKYELLNAEARRRTTESNLAKARNEALDLKAKLEAQQQFLAAPSISQEEQDRLDELKYSDPDQWRIEMDRVQAQAANEFDAKFKEVYSGKKQELSKQAFNSMVEQTLETYNSFTDKKLTTEQLQNDIPPRLTAQLSEGKILVNEYLQKASEYVYGNRVVANTEVPVEPSFSDTPGATNPNVNHSGDKSLGDMMQELF